MFEPLEPPCRDPNDDWIEKKDYTIIKFKEAQNLIESINANVAGPANTDELVNDLYDLASFFGIDVEFYYENLKFEKKERCNE